MGQQQQQQQQPQHGSVSHVSGMMGKLDLGALDVDKLVAQLPDALVSMPFFLTTLSGVVLYMSPRLCAAMSGDPAAAAATSADMRGVELAPRLHTLERDAVMGVLNAAAESGAPFQIVMNIRVRDGGPFALLSGEGQKLELQLGGGQGALPCLAVMMGDVRAADELVRPRVPGSFFSRHSAAGIYLQASPTVEQVLGFKSTDLCGHSAYQMYHPEDCERVGEMHRSAAAGPVTVQYRHVTQWGQFQWLEMTVKPVINARERRVEYIMCTHKVIPPPS